MMGVDGPWAGHDRRAAAAGEARTAVFSLAVESVDPVPSWVLDRIILDRLRGVIRRGDLVVPYTSQRFGLLCQQMPGDRAVYRIAQRLEASLVRAIELDGHPVWVQVSMGVGMIAPGRSWMEARHRAEIMRASSLAWTERATELAADVRTVAEASGGEPTLALLRSPDPEVLAEIGKVLAEHAPAGSGRLGAVGGDGMAAVLPRATIADALWLADGVRAVVFARTGKPVVAGAARIGPDGRPRLFAISRDHLGSDLEGAAA